MIIVVLTTLGWLLITAGAFQEGGSAVQILLILRVCRVARVIRLAKRAESTKALLRTLLLALPAVANVATLFLLFVYIFAIVGMHMFGRMERDGNFFNNHANFKNVGVGMLTLFRCATGESWNGIMYDLMDRSPDPLSAFGAMAFFTIFQLIGSMMFLNLIVAVVLDQFGTVTTRNRMPITPVNIQQFNKAWSEVAREIYTYDECEDLMIDTLRKKQNDLDVHGGTTPSTKKSRITLGISTTENKKSTDVEDHWNEIEEEQIPPKKVRALRVSLLPYLPIESLHYVLEKVPPPLGVHVRNASQKKINTEITNIIMNLHTNIHSTPYSATSVESFEVLVALAARKFDEKATILPKNAVGIRAGIADAITRNKKHLNEGWIGGAERKEREYDDFTLGQMYAGISVIQRHSRNYLKYLKEHVRELRRVAKKTRPQDPVKVEAVVKIQKWYHRIMGRVHMMELVSAIRRKMQQVRKEEREKNQNQQNLNKSGRKEEKDSQQRTSVEQERSKQQDHVLHERNLSSVLLENHANENLKMNTKIAAINKIQKWYRYYSHTTDIKEIGREMRKHIKDKIIIEDQHKKELTELRQQLEQTTLQLQIATKQQLKEKEERERIQRNDAEKTKQLHDAAMLKMKQEQENITQDVTAAELHMSSLQHQQNTDDKQQQLWSNNEQKKQKPSVQARLSIPESLSGLPSNGKGGTTTHPGTTINIVIEEPKTLAKTSDTEEPITTPSSSLNSTNKTSPPVVTTTAAAANAADDVDIDAPRTATAKSTTTPTTSSTTSSTTLSTKLTTPSHSQNDSKLWKNDMSCPSCHDCQKQFSWLRARHHCRMCGDIFCSNCTSEERMLPAYLTVEGVVPNPDRNPVKVCNSCASNFDQGRLPKHAQTPTKKKRSNEALIEKRRKKIERRKSMKAEKNKKK